MSISNANCYARKTIENGKTIELCKGVINGGTKAERKAFAAEVLEGKHLIPGWNGYIPGNTMKKLKAGSLI